MTDIVTFKLESENLTPEKYLSLNSGERANIQSSKIIPPLLGGKDFGNIQVTYRTPTYKAFGIK